MNEIFFFTLSKHIASETRFEAFLIAILFENMSQI